MREPPTNDYQLPGMRRFPWRFAVYGVVILYLAADLYLFRGPLRQRIERIRGGDVDAIELARREGIVATVKAHPIRRQELALAVEEYCLRRGLEAEDLPRERLNAIRVLVLDELVVDRLIWFHSHHTAVELGEDEVAEARRRFRRGFTSEEEFEKAAAAQGFDVARLDAFLENQAMQRAWIEKTIAPHIGVTEEEVRERFESDQAASTVPERVRARQIFLATLDKDPAEVKAAAELIAGRLKAGESFADLAAELSEDERSKAGGGIWGGSVANVFQRTSPQRCSPSRPVESVPRSRQNLAGTSSRWSSVGPGAERSWRRCATRSPPPSRRRSAPRSSMP